MKAGVKQQLSELRWQRLNLTLVLTAPPRIIKAHPISVFQSIVKWVSSIADEIELDKSMTHSSGKPYETRVFFHVKGKNHNFSLVQYEKYPLEILFCGFEPDYVNKWRSACTTYFDVPHNSRNFNIFYLDEPEERSLEKIEVELGDIADEGELCLEFLTPYPFVKLEKYKMRTFISKDTFINSFERRFANLFGGDFKYESGEDNFSLLPYYWHYSEIKHPSHSQKGHTQFIKGCTGNLYIKGKYKDFLPFLLLGSELHAGTKISNSQGYYILHKESQPYFKKFFPNKKVIRAVIRDAVNRYDSALQTLVIDRKHPFDEEIFSENLAKELLEDKYEPTPNIAFRIKKPNGRVRLVEQLSFKDLIVQQYILKVITPVFDRMFEEGSIGFRRGYSRQRAAEMIKETIKEGYQYVIESDIEDFFPSVEHSTLFKLLDFYLPQQDTLIKQLIVKSVLNRYRLSVLYTREKGLPQGSPLSPILANLYLDYFDEKLQTLGFKMIRYGDDFVIFTKNKDDAKYALSQAESCLSEIGLKLKKEKTAIKPIKDGFWFLGMYFTLSEEVIQPEEDFKRFKKPLYVTEPYLFLSVNGDAIDIYRSRQLVETIPLRRISEIIVMDKTTFSSALINKCTRMNIPLSIALGTGYYITTIKPDSKRYYDVSYEHSKKYHSLSDTEILVFAKEIAVSKITGFASLFKQRYKKGDVHFFRALDRTVNSIYQAGDVDEVRGLEGNAAKLIYQKLDEHIDQEGFHLKKRDRKNPDRMNSLLNFAYYSLFSRINATVRAVGLNPYLGFLHSPADDYESLVCDIEELFRARIVRFILRLVNLQIITKDDFLKTDSGFYLTKDGKKKFLERFEAEMNSKASKEFLSLKESIYVQVIIIKRWAVDEKPLVFNRWEI